MNRQDAAHAIMAEDRFCWHAHARLMDEVGRAHSPCAAPLGGVLPDDRAVGALQGAGGARAFRIGAPHAPAPVAPPSLAPDTPLFETLSGGTSGQPRRIMRTQASWIASFRVNGGMFGIGPGAKVAVIGRLVHSLALYAALEGLYLGAEVHLLTGLRPDRLARALNDRGITHLYATPAQLRMLPDVAGPAPTMRHVLVGGARLDAGLRARLSARFPAAQLAEFYGAAETSFLTLSQADTPEGSVGTAYPGVALRVDAVGLIWARSPYLALGYGAGDDRPGGALWQSGWVAPGETGRITPHGDVILSGRAARLIRVAEQSLHPEEMEAFLMAQPGLTQATVLPRPDARRGAVPVAVLQGTPAAQTAIRAALRAAFGPALAPRALIWWAGDWPLLPSGKTDLAALAAHVAEGAAWS